MKGQFINGLRNLGIQPADTLMVHSSFKSLGPAAESPAAAAEALMEAVSEGTLLLPGLTYEYVTRRNPRFSVADTPCCVGIIPETFRKRPGVIRSVHPTHSVCAYGKDAVPITEKHYLDRSPVGENSPFRQLVKYGGKILLLGCGLEPNTFMHGVEEAAGAPYVFNKYKARFEIEYIDGRVEEAWHMTHGFRDVEQRYDRVEGLLEIKKGKVLEADAYVMDAAALWKIVFDTLEKNKEYFVEKREK
jgi:aminoglycoside 3-N-acetyltransferase